MLLVRPARDIDQAFVIATASRLSSFGPPPWRADVDVVAGEVRTLRAFFEAPTASCALFIAESGADGPVGFVYLEEGRDYFTLERHGHIGIIAVSELQEGRGAGAALMRAAEAWSRGRAHRVLTLNVFEGNRHARDVYEHFGYQPDTIKYIKVLDPDAAAGSDGARPAP